MNFKDITIYKFLGWLYMALVFAALISGVYYLQMKNLPIDSAIVHQEPEWKTYTNKEYGFEFQYPKTFSHSESNNTFLDATHSFSIQVEATVNLKNPPEPTSSNLTNLITQEEKLLRNESGQISCPKFPWPVRDGAICYRENFGDIKALVFYAHAINDEWSKKVVFYSGSYRYSIHFADKIYKEYDSGQDFINKNQDKIKLFDQILSTFKFIEPEICIQVITKAKNKITGEIKDFPTPCAVPEGWEKVNN